MRVMTVMRVLRVMRVKPVDYYHVLSESLLPRIKNFVIDPPSDLSDHCPLVTTLAERNYSTHQFVKLCNTSSAFLEDLMLRNSPTDALSSPSLQSKYCWTLESERDVATGWSTTVFNQSLDYLSLEAQHNTVNENIFQFTNLLQIMLSKCPSLILKRKCKPNQCKELKRRVRNSGKIVKENPDVVREQFWRLKKQLKTLIRKKKRKAA